MKGIFDFQKAIINVFDPEKVSFDSEEVFIGCDHGDKPDTTIEVKMAFKDGNIYVIDENIRPTRKDEKLPYIWMVKNNEIELKPPEITGSYWEPSGQHMKYE